MNHYEERLERKRYRLRVRAERAQAESAALHRSSRALIEHIPFGQPILVGHHSETRHRNALKRSWNRLGKAVMAQRRAEQLARRAERVGTGGISSDDPDSITKLKEKLAKMEAGQRRMAAVNAAWRAAKKPAPDDTPGWQKVADRLGEPLDNFTQLRVEFARYSYQGQPVPPFALSNNGANIRRVKERIAHLERQHARAAEVEATTGKQTVEHRYGDVRVVENFELNRLQIIFPAKPAADVRQRLRGFGFKWSRTEGAWQRHLGTNAMWCAETLLGLKREETAHA